MNALIKSLPTRRFLGEFSRSFQEEPVIGERYVIVRVDAEDKMTATFARLQDVYPNVNTGSPSYVFEYETLRGRSPHDFARVIIRGDVYYSLYQA